MMAARPEILFLCVHNAGRSQMAAAFARSLGGDQVVVHSAGSEPGVSLHPAVITAMREVGLDISGESPRQLTEEMGLRAEVVVTMGCGDACPVYPGTRYEDWVLADPAGLGIDAVRAIRDAIEQRVRTLLAELLGEVRNSPGP
jgi:protein-tyrosine-phosphatase